MAWLGEVDATGRSTAEAVEEALYPHRQPLLGEVSGAFFDTTSLWFEGAGGETLGQRGHSKDYRGHLKQVVLGITPMSSCTVISAKRSTISTCLLSPTMEPCLRPIPHPTPSIRPA